MSQRMEHEKKQGILAMEELVRNLNNVAMKNRLFVQSKVTEWNA